MTDEPTPMTGEPTPMTDEPTPIGAAGGSTSEDAPEPAPATVVAAEPAPTAMGRGSRGRWLIAGGVVIASAAVALGAAALLASRPTPEALSYIPGDSAFVAELRLDLPGDQLQKVGNLLAHFPGFKDQSTLPQKIDETLTRLTRSATTGAVDYATQVKPWIAGPVFAAASAGPAGATATPGREAAIVVVATTDGTARCESLFGSATPTSSTYAGVMLLTNTNGTLACALDRRFGVFGTPAGVRAALDAHANHAGMDHSSEYRAARDALGGDRLATAYISTHALTSSLGGTGLPIPSDAFAALQRTPAWVMEGVSAEDDALVADVVSAPIPEAAGAAIPSGLASVPPPHVSAFPALLPADTIALVDVHSVGAGISNALAALRANPALAPSLGQVDGSLAALGGIDQLVDWVGDVGLAVVPDGTTVSGGAILLAPDDATATAKVAQVRGLLQIGLGTRAQVTDTTINGTPVTVFDLGPVGPLLSGLGGSATTLPIPPDAHVVLSIAAKGKAVFVGGDAFVRRSLELQAGGSLADAAAFKHVMSRAATENLALVYLGTSSLLDLAISALPEAERTPFVSDTKPYLDPFEAVAITITMDHGAARARFVAIVK